MAERKPLVIAIIVVSVVLLAAIVTLITVTAIKSKQGTRKVNMYYRGMGVRMASVKRRANSSPTSWCIGTFNRVLPGTVSVVQGGTDLQTSQDLRPYISRGDPIKVGPQIFVVSPDMRRAFTPSTLPLDTSTSWINEADGVVHPSPGKLLGISAQHITVYTCETCEMPFNTWTGPRGGAIGYWDASGRWRHGNCPGSCPQWYSPLFLGANGTQVDGPSPGTIAKVKNRVHPFSSKTGGAAGSPPSSTSTDSTPPPPRPNIIMQSPMQPIQVLTHPSQHFPPPPPPFMTPPMQPPPMQPMYALPMQPMHAPPPMQPMQAMQPMQPMHPPPMHPPPPMQPMYAPPMQPMHPLQMQAPPAPHIF